MGGSSKRLRLKALRPQLRRVMALAHLREISADTVARQAETPRRRFKHLLSLLRGSGLARTVTLYRPERLERPLQVRTLVRLAAKDVAARAVFERLCREDTAVSWAAVVTGAHDYLLIGHHRDARAHNAWLRLLESRAEVRAVDSQILGMRFGHMLGGAVVSGADNDDEARREVAG